MTPSTISMTMMNSILWRIKCKGMPQISSKRATKILKSKICHLIHRYGSLLFKCKAAWPQSLHCCAVWCTLCILTLLRVCWGLCTSSLYASFQVSAWQLISLLPPIWRTWCSKVRTRIPSMLSSWTLRTQKRILWERQRSWPCSAGWICSYTPWRLYSFLAFTRW